MDLKQLEYFITIINEGTISAAAKKLHISQPPLSNQMKLLENELGCQLFERGTRQIKITEAGRILYHKALTMLDLSKYTKEELDAYKMGLSGTLRIGIVSSAGSIFLHNWIFPFHQANPDIHYEIFEGNTYQLLELLKTDSLDFAVVRTPFNLYPFQCIHLLKESIVAIGHKEFFQNHTLEDSVTLSELCGKPILLYRRWESIILNLLKEQDIQWNIFCKNDDARTTLLWAEEGLGIGIVPESALGFIHSEPIIIKKIKDCKINSTISIVNSTKIHKSSIAKQFLDFISTKPEI